jgi:hypothetical protein
MKLRTLTALLSTGALALTLAACGESDKEDDTGSESDTDETPEDDEDCLEVEFEDDAEEWCDCDENEDHPDYEERCPDEEEPEFEVDAVYAQFEVTLRDYEMVPYIYDDEPVEGFVYFWFVDGDAWEGTEDTDNGCIVAYNLTADAGLADADLSSDAWWGWELDTLIPEAEADVTSLAGWSDRCDEITNLDLHPIEIMDSHTWGVGIGPMSSDLSTALENAWGAEDWATYEPSAFGGYLNIDAGTDAGGITELSYGLAFGIEADNTLIVNDDNTLEFIEVGDDGNAGSGYFRAFPAYGLDATAL